MNKLVVVLAATTVAGAAAALYYRQALIEARADSATKAAPAPAPVSRTVAAAAAASPAPATASAPMSGTASPAKADSPPPATAAPGIPPPVLVSDDRKSRNQRQASEFLKRYDDPSRRGELRAQALDRTRQIFAEYAKQRNLDADQFDKLMAVLTDQELERRAAQARCQVRPDCDKPGDDYKELLARQKQTLIDMVGEDGFRELWAWGASQTDRRMADAFAKRLPDTVPWSSEQSAALASVLKEGRDAAMREMYSQRQHFKGFGNQEGVSVMYADELPTLEARLASANAFAQRMRDQAATVLSGEQLKVFNQMQEEVLLDLARFLRRLEPEQRETR